MMKLQQVCRFRLGNQEVGAGYQICGTSAGTTSLIEDEFSSVVTTVSMTEADTVNGFVADWSLGDSRKYFYWSVITPGYDATEGRRLTPLAHGLVLSKEDGELLLEHPQLFYRFTRDKFITKWNAADLTKVRLQEIELDEKADTIAVSAILQKYGIEGETVRELIWRIYETVLSDGNIPSFTFVTKEKGEARLEVMQDMMVLVYSVLPKSLRSRVSFSFGEVRGMRQRMFTVRNQASGESYMQLDAPYVYGNLDANTAENAYRYGLCDYIAAHLEDGQYAKLLFSLDEKLREFFRRPDLKKGSVLLEVMNAAFLVQIPEMGSRLNGSEINRSAYGLTKIQADHKLAYEDFMADAIHMVTEQGGSFNDIQLRNLQAIHATSESEKFGKELQIAYAMKDENTVYNTLLDILKGPSNTKNDEMAVRLIERLTEEYLTRQEYMDALGRHYFETENEKLKNKYWACVKNLYRTEAAASYDLSGQLNLVIANIEKGTSEEPAFKLSVGLLNLHLDGIRTYLRNFQDKDIIITEDIYQRLAKIADKISGKQTKYNFVEEFLLNYDDYTSDTDRIEKHLSILRQCSRQDLEGYLLKKCKNKHPYIIDHYYANYVFPGKEISNLTAAVSFAREIKDANLGDMPETEKALHDKIDSIIKIQYMPKLLAGRKSFTGDDIQKFGDRFGELKKQLDELKRIFNNNAFRNECIEYEHRFIVAFWECIEPSCNLIGQIDYERFACPENENFNNMKELERYVESLQSNQLDEANVQFLLEEDPNKKYAPDVRAYILKDVRIDTEPDINKILLRYYSVEKGKFTEKNLAELLNRVCRREEAYNSVFIQMHPELGKYLDSNGTSGGIWNRVKKPALFAVPILLLLLLTVVIIPMLLKKTINGGEDRTLTEAANGTEIQMEGKTETAEENRTETVKESKVETETTNEVESESESETEESSPENSVQEQSNEKGNVDKNQLSEDEFREAFYVHFDGSDYVTDTENKGIYNITKNGLIKGNESILSKPQVVDYTDDSSQIIDQYIFMLERYDSEGKPSTIRRYQSEIDNQFRTNIQFETTISSYIALSPEVMFAVADNGTVYLCDLHQSDTDKQIRETLITDAASITATEDALFVASGNSILKYYISELTTPGGFEVEAETIASFDNPEYPVDTIAIYEGNVVGFVSSNVLYKYDTQNGQVTKLRTIDPNEQYIFKDGRFYGSAYHKENSFEKACIDCVSGNVQWVK